MSNYLINQEIQTRVNITLLISIEMKPPERVKVTPAAFYARLLKLTLNKRSSKVYKHGSDTRVEMCKQRVS